MKKIPVNFPSFTSTACIAINLQFFLLKLVVSVSMTIKRPKEKIL